MQWINLNPDTLRDTSEHTYSLLLKFSRGFKIYILDSVTYTKVISLGHISLHFVMCLFPTSPFL